MTTQHTPFGLSPRWYLCAQEAHHMLYTLGSAGSVGSLVVEWWTHDQKVLGSSPERRKGSIFFSKVNFLWWILFWYPIHSCVTAVACKSLVILPKVQVAGYS